MKLITLKCPNCGAALDAEAEFNSVIHCDKCRYDIFVERGEAELAPLKPLPKKEPSDWDIFWERIFKGDYYDIDEVKRENSSRH